MAANATIAILTDFGSRAGYPAAMKGILRALAPAATLVDISHEIAPQDVAGAALALERCYSYFPPATVFLVVVDPGVGSARRALALAAGGYRFVAPDNGVLTPMLRAHPDWRANALTESRYWRPDPSDTYHGRDIFAPVAAHWANGTSRQDFGPAITDPLRLPLPAARWEEAQATLRGQVSTVDYFGNLLTNIGPLRREGDALEWRGDAGERVTLQAAHTRLWVAGSEIMGIRRTYADGARGEMIAVLDSSGYLEIAICEGNAAASLRAKPGTPVTLWAEK